MKTENQRVSQIKLENSNENVKTASNMCHKKVYMLASGRGDGSWHCDKANFNSDREKDTLYDLPPD